ncbi:MAG: DUF5667 domain-containing protein [Patescibacteria group bacterium]
MKKIFIPSALALIVLFVFMSSTSFAQNQQIQLPSAGLTPESSFYFLDRLGEALQQFFTFNPEAKAHLQITFAAERVAEIKVVLETKGIGAKGLGVAQSLLQAHLANAATIIKDQKSEGKDVSQLAKELDDEFEVPKTALEQTFKDEERTLKTLEKELKIKIRAARQAGDTAQVEALAKELGVVKAQKELLELKEEEQEETLEREEEKIEREMEKKEDAEKAIKKAKEEKQEILDEAGREGLVIPAEAFNSFDNHLSKARAAFEAGKFEEAKDHAKEAKESLEKIKDSIEVLNEAKDNEEEMKADREEREQEVRQTQNEKVKEKAKKESENLREEQKKANEETKKAEEQLRDAGKEEEGD